MVNTNVAMIFKSYVPYPRSTSLILIKRKAGPRSKIQCVTTNYVLNSLNNIALIRHLNHFDNTAKDIKALQEMLKKSW